mgnify:CR=1 FL=1
MLKQAAAGDNRMGVKPPRFPVRNILLPLAVLLVVAVVVLRLRGPELAAFRIQAQPLVQTVVATGRVISTSRAQVGSEVTGTVRQRRVSEGDRVQPGDVLAELHAEDLQARVREAEAALQQLQRTTRSQNEAALRQAQVQQAQAERELERRQGLFARQLISREAMEQAEQAVEVARAQTDRARSAAAATASGSSEEVQARERLAAARAQLGKATIRSAVSGVVLTRNAEPGDLVQPGRVLFEIARGGDTEIEVPVDEKNLAVLALGQSASCIADAWPNRPFPATVTYIAPSVDATRGTITIRLRVDPVPAFLLQDMTVSVNVETGRRESALVVPNDALLDREPGHPAVLAVREGRIARIQVETGLQGLTSTEVISGVAAGDVVLLNAAAITARPGSRVRAALQSTALTDPATASRRELPVQLD